MTVPRESRDDVLTIKNCAGDTVLASRCDIDGRMRWRGQSRPLHKPAYQRRLRSPPRAEPGQFLNSHFVIEDPEPSNCGSDGMKLRGECECGLRWHSIEVRAGGVRCVVCACARVRNSAPGLPPRPFHRALEGHPLDRPPESTVAGPTARHRRGAKDPAPSPATPEAARSRPPGCRRVECGPWWCDGVTPRPGSRPPPPRLTQG